MITIVVRSIGTVTRNLGKRLGKLGKTCDYPDHNTAKVNKDTLKTPGDQRRLAVTQIRVEKQPLLSWCEYLTMQQTNAKRVQNKI